MYLIWSFFETVTIIWLNIKLKFWNNVCNFLRLHCSFTSISSKTIAVNRPRIIGGNLSLSGDNEKTSFTERINTFNLRSKQIIPFIHICAKYEAYFSLHKYVFMNQSTLPFCKLNLTLAYHTSVELHAYHTWV